MAALLSIQAPTLKIPILSDARLESVDGNRCRSLSRALQVWPAIIKPLNQLP
jgi:hypothetical protein